MKIKEKLKKYNQTQLLRFEKELDEEKRKALHKQIERLNFSYLENLQLKESPIGEISPIKAMTLSEIDENKGRFKQIGLKALKNQEVGALLLAGGMGTRLGFDRPKGMYDIGKTRKISIFEKLIENLMKNVFECGKSVPLFIMTSEKNHDETVKFFEENDYFGYDKGNVCFFVQEMAPCVNFEGKILLEEKGKVATSPNGNGGWFNSLLKNEKAKTMLDKYNLKWINVFSVDNVLQQIADPVFIGATIDGGYEVGAKVIKKADAFEKVGVMCNRDGKPSVVEYIDLPDDMAKLVDEKGERVYNFGVTLNYLFKVDLLYNIKDNKLPLHVVTKKVEHIDEKGDKIVPKEPNAFKFEFLCVDMVQLSSSCLPFEVVREREFAPIKNKTGVDSVESAQKLLELNGYLL